MKRRLFHIAATVSLVLCFTCVALVVSNCFYGTFGFRWHRLTIDVYPTRIVVSLQLQPPTRLAAPSPDAFVREAILMGQRRIRPLPGITWDREYNQYTRASDKSETWVRRVGVEAEWWLLIVATALLPAIALGRLTLRRAAHPPGPRCPWCYYDLAGNVSGVCPECGKAIESRNTPPDSPSR